MFLDDLPDDPLLTAVEISTKDKDGDETDADNDSFQSLLAQKK